MEKVLLVTEYLNPPYDEGIKKTVYNLFLDLDKKYELQVICRYGFKKDNIHIVDTNPLFYSSEIRSIIKKFTPEVLIYLPFQSSTFASYLRLKILTGFTKNNNALFIALQPKPIIKWQQSIIKYIKPGFALTPSPTLSQFWNKLKIKNQLIPLLTDLTVFKLVDTPDEKQRLREKYNLPIDAFIISHMGHLNEGRNLKSLIPLQKAGYQVIIIASSSTPKDALGGIALIQELKRSGIIIINEFIDHIEEIYQLSDLYIFPVERENSSIGMPLSILEARACGIPVLTTDYGSIEYFLGDDLKGIYYSLPDNFLKKIEEIFRNSKNTKYSRSKIISLNDEFYETINSAIIRFHK